MTSTPELILASASPQRRALLAELDVPFETVTSPYREPELPAAAAAPRALAEALAYFKARAVAQRHPDRLVLGADTLVACAGHVLGKPRDRADARRMLEMQARHPSEVFTGVALVRECAGEGMTCNIFSERTRVWMHDDGQVRERYLDTDDWSDKAGAYGIQAGGDALVARIEGSFSNVVGLPLERLRVVLSTMLLGQVG